MDESGSGSQDTDIEVVEVRRNVTSVTNPPTHESSSIGATEFVWQELSGNGEHVSRDSLKAALKKYDVLATPDQIHDMVSMFGSGCALDRLQVREIFLKCSIRTNPQGN